MQKPWWVQFLYFTGPDGIYFRFTSLFVELQYNGVHTQQPLICSCSVMVCWCLLSVHSSSAGCHLTPSGNFQVTLFSAVTDCWLHYLHVKLSLCAGNGEWRQHLIKVPKSVSLTICSITNLFTMLVHDMRCHSDYSVQWGQQTFSWVQYNQKKPAPNNPWWSMSVKLGVIR